MTTARTAFRDHVDAACAQALEVTLLEHLAAERELGQSWRAIATRLNRLLDLEVTDETLRLWGRAGGVS